ncbi:hypothetical protein [Sorangium sp. So ce1078]|uniref:hypothetical protein n=1 Tax=Sorangium sp. So ce1078 TaxID=3133329 RepID=UPI003F60D021
MPRFRSFTQSCSHVGSPPGASEHLAKCVACERYATLAIHPSGKKIYVVCDPLDDAPAGGA